MPLDYGCRFDQHHGVEDLRPNLVKPHPEEPVCAEQPRATWSLPPQDGHLMSQGDEFKLQGGAAANTEREQGNQGGMNCDHAHDGMAVARKSLAFLNFQGFEQPQLVFASDQGSEKCRHRPEPARPNSYRLRRRWHSGSSYYRPHQKHHSNHAQARLRLIVASEIAGTSAACRSRF